MKININNSNTSRGHFYHSRSPLSTYIATQEDILTLDTLVLSTTYHNLAFYDGIKVVIEKVKSFTEQILKI